MGPTEIIRFRGMFKFGEVSSFIIVGCGALDGTIPREEEMKYLLSVVEPAGLISLEF